MSQQISDTNNNGELIRKRKKRKSRNHKKFKIAGIIIVIILALVAIFAGALFALSSMGENNLKAKDYSEGKEIEYNGSKYKYNENIVSTAIIGYDQRSKDEAEGRSGQADFLMLLALDTETGKLKAISIPRDSMVELDNYVGGAYLGAGVPQQIALAYANGDGRETSCEYTKTAMSRLLFNMPIKNYFSLNLDGIGPINDAIGGVNLVPIESIPNTSINKDQRLTLMGNNAKRYVQYRDKSRLDSAELRRAREIQYFKSFYNQAFAKSNGINTAIDLFNLSKQYAITNIGLPEVTYLSQVLLNKGISEVETISVPGYVSEGPNFVEFNVDKDKLFEIILNTFYIKET